MLGLNYMAWIGIVIWLGVPLLAFFTTRLLWRRSRSDLSKLWALVAGVVILFTPALISNGVKAYYDRQVQEMCAKDGGVRVYETVKLPAEKFDQWGNVGVPNKRYTKPSDSYYSEFEDHYFRRGNPSLLRIRTWIVRKSDGKVLGESIRYTRARGDLPGPWEGGTSFHCPEIAMAEGKLESSIFQKGL